MSNIRWGVAYGLATVAMAIVNVAYRISEVGVADAMDATAKRHNDKAYSEAHADSLTWDAPEMINHDDDHICRGRTGRPCPECGRVNGSNSNLTSWPELR